MNDLRKTFFFLTALLFPHGIFSSAPLVVVELTSQDRAKEIATYELLRSLKIDNPADAIKAVQAALEKGACTRAQSEECPFILLATVWQGLPVVKALLNHGADVNAASSRGKTTPLMAASEAGKLELVEAFIEAQALVNTQSNDNSTALMLAARNGHHKVVQYLLNKGKASTLLTDFSKKMALDYAREKGDEECIALLELAEDKQLAHELAKLS